MNKRFFPIIGAAIAIVSTAAGQAEVATTSCSENAPHTQCLPVIFHNQSMTLLPPSPNNHQGLKPLAVHEYTMTQSHIKIAPVYDYPNTGQASKIDLHNMGDAIFRFDLVDEPLGFYTIQASGVFTMKIRPYTSATWACQLEEQALKTPSNPKERVDYEVNVKIPNFLEYGVCNYLGPNHYSCTCEYKVTPTLQNLKEK